MSPFRHARAGLVVAVAILLIAGPVGAAVDLEPGADSVRPQTDGEPSTLRASPGMPSMLHPPDATSTTAEIATADGDLAAAITASTHGVRGSIATRNYLDRMDEATSSAQRRITRERLTAIETSIERLQTRQTALLRGYQNGTVERETFLRRYGLVQSAAETIGTRLDRIENYLTESAAPGLISVFYTDLRAIEGRLAALSSPVRHRALGGLTGTGDAATLYLVAGTEATVAAAYEGDQYLREATVQANRDLDAPDQFAQQTEYDVSPVVDRAYELYPWVQNNSFQEVPDYRQLGNLYRVQTGHPLGELVTYLDGGTTDVYHEVQRLRPGAVPAATAVTNRTEALTVTVEPTVPTGPMRVEVSQTSTEAPISATVHVDGTRVGEVDGSGVLWTFQPRGQFTVTATHDGDAVTVAGP